MTLKERIHDYIKRKPWASFVDLEREFEDEMKGDWNLSMNNFNNLVLWSGVNSEFSDAISQLHSEKKIKFIYEGPDIGQLNYAMDGLLMELPIATEFREYDEPHWLPIVLIDYETYYRDFANSR